MISILGRTVRSDSLCKHIVPFLTCRSLSSHHHHHRKRYPPRSSIRVKNIGKISYQEALNLQHHYVNKLIHSQNPLQDEIILLCEHNPPVYTVGKRVKHYDDEKQRLKSLHPHADFHKVDRGGIITFHGPGQLVGYPILNLRHGIEGVHEGKGVRRYVERVEECLIRLCLDAYGVDVTRSKDTGVWLGNDKIAAIGIQVKRWVSFHGFGLNCNTDLRYFEDIVPCGLVGKGVTSLSEVVGREGELLLFCIIFYCLYVTFFI